MSTDLVQWGKVVFHITHQKNLPGILAKGLFSTNELMRLKMTARSIADAAIQLRRGATQVTVGNGGTLHDYVPIFFAARSPMLYAVGKRHPPPSDTVHLAIDWSVLDKGGTIFTDGCAASTCGRTRFYDDRRYLSLVDQDALRILYWGGSMEDSRKKAAEVLAHKHVSPSYLRAIVVKNDSARDAVEKIVEAQGGQLPVFVLPEYYYP